MQVIGLYTPIPLVDHLFLPSAKVEDPDARVKF